MRVLFRLAVVLAGLAVALLLTAELYVYAQSRGKHSAETGDIPSSGGAGVVLGCAPHIQGRANRYFVERIASAAELWRAGKVSCFIVTGDNSSRNYNEPEAMKRALIDAGVPEQAIVCDFAGLRTLDSIVRARAIFGARRLVIVSQEFHNKRALAIASHFGIDAFAKDAKDISRRSHRLRSWLRERAARVAMLIDLFVLNRQPRHMGERETLPNHVGTSAVDSRPIRDGEKYM